MTKSFLLFGLLLFWITPVVASPDDPMLPILAAANEPFISFVDSTIRVVLPPLPPPGDKLSDPKLSQVRDLLSSRISSVDVRVDPAHKNELIATLNAMCSLREWLLQHPVYSNITLSFRINETACLAVLAGLSSGTITTEDAKRIAGSLNENPSVDKLLLAAEGGVPKSKAIMEFKERSGSESLLELSGKLGKEQGIEDYLSENPNNYLKQIDPSEFILNAIGCDEITYATKLWVEYMSKGGNLNLEVKDLKSDLKDKMPEIMGEELKTPYIGNQVDWQRMEDLIKESRRWSVVHFAK